MQSFGKNFILRYVRQSLAKKAIFLNSSKNCAYLTPALNSKTLAFSRASFGFSTSSKATSNEPNHHNNSLKSSYQADGFYVEQLFTGCLAIYSYYIESGDDCFIIDPQNDITLYVDLISSRKKNIKGIFVSHYHADYVSGQHELAKKYSCKIYMGPKSIPSEIVVTMKDKQTINMGQVQLQLLHTPGHTEQSSCLLVIDKSKKQSTIFTGDTLFLNEVGRPDLAVKTNLSAKDLASLLYESICKVKMLSDDVRIYPGHGSGSSCGKSIGKGDFCTLGTQKQNNYALKIQSKDQFVDKVLNEMPKPPPYFGYNANINKFSPFSYKQAEEKVHHHLNPEQVNNLVTKQNALILDVRNTDQLIDGILQNSICIGFDGAFANWVGTLISPETKLIIYGNQGQAKGAIGRLLRIGYTNILGHANFNIKEWKNKNFPLYTPVLTNNVLESEHTVLDVRKPQQWKNDGIVMGEVLQIELTELFKDTSKVDKNKNYVIHCKSGYRAKIAYTFLRSKGFTKLKLYPTTFDSILLSGDAKISRE